MILDLFAGPGGWDQGLRYLDIESVVGLELDASTCATRAAAGLLTIRCDIPRYPTEPFVNRVEGLIASPPCTSFSNAGKRRGFRDIPLIHRGLQDLRYGLDTRLELAERASDPTSLLVLEVPRWVRDVHPQWVALEQVPPVLPLWYLFEDFLHDFGYSTWCGVLNSADYGVPQTRSRAVLMAHRGRVVHPPFPTHAEHPQDAYAAPWVSMATALGWSIEGEMGFPRKDDRDQSEDGYRTRDWRNIDKPSFSLTEKARSWVVRTGTNSMKHNRLAKDVVGYERSLDRPAPTLDRKAGGAWQIVGVNTGKDWKKGGSRDDAQVISADKPAPTIASDHGGAHNWNLIGVSREEIESGEWVHHRPATTIMGDHRVFAPGGHEANDGRDNTKQSKRSDNAIKLLAAEAGVLQSFPIDYPWRGTKSDQFSQIGNAIPPLLAAHVLYELVKPLRRIRRVQQGQASSDPDRRSARRSPATGGPLTQSGLAGVGRRVHVRRRQRDP